MAKQERGLGRGLGALLGGAETDMANFRRPVQYINPTADSAKKAAKDGDMMVLEIGEIEPNPNQPRITFDEQALAELADSIRELGVIQPITVRAVDGGKYQIISGERRFRASRIAGLKTIPAYVRSASDDAAVLEMAIVENVQRENLDPIETAVSFQRLIDECHLTQDQMAQRIGKSRVAVTNYLRLLRLPAKVQYDVKTGNISVGHAKVLLGLEDKALQEKLSTAIIRDGLSVRDLEKAIKNPNSKTCKDSANDSKSDQAEELPENYYKVAEYLGRFFNNQVSIRRNAAGKGSITVRFTDDSQIEALLNSLEKE